MVVIEIEDDNVKIAQGLPCELYVGLGLELFKCALKTGKIIPSYLKYLIEYELEKKDGKESV